MLMIDRAAGRFEDHSFLDFPAYLRRGDCLVLNNTRVFPARLQGRRNRPDGAVVELFLLRALDEAETVWRVLAKPAKRARTADRILLSSTLQAEITGENSRGERLIQFHSCSGSVREQLETLGSVPLPPYIHRSPTEADRDRYQTVFARERGSVAAPTAGLHFTPDLLERCRARGADLAYVTLHVGLGTFAPLPEGDLERIQLHEERFDFSPESAAKLERASRRVCVGTTSVRTLESALLRGDYVPASGETDLFIRPGFQFRGTDALLTNFHLPQSSLLMLVCAFGGYELVMNAYRHAVAQRYRFFSYGDCMLII